MRQPAHSPSTLTRALALFATTAGALGCATVPIKAERRPDGIWHLTCQTPLPKCLAEAEKRCDRLRYVVLRAFDDRENKGDTVAPSEFRRSEAFVRCGFAPAWGTENKELKEAPLCPAPPAPAAPPQQQGCTPGLSLACTGPAGCKGGQVCLPDGARFGPCECGPPTAAPPSAP
jgi:hypothetical protein